MYTAAAPIATTESTSARMREFTEVTSRRDSIRSLAARVQSIATGARYPGPSTDAGARAMAPVERPLEPVFERHGWLVTEQGFGFGDVGLRVADVAGSRRLIGGL